MVRLNIPKLSGIYKIQSIVNGKIYVGSAVNLHNRKKDHFNGLKKNKHGNGYLQNHTNIYGLNDLEFHIIEFCPKENLIVREQYYIDTLKTDFNICKIAGSSFGVKRSEEQCRKHSEFMKKMVGNKAIHYNCHHTEETKNILRKKSEGNTNASGKRTEETKLKISKGTKQGMQNMSLYKKEEQRQIHKSIMLKRFENIEERKKMSEKMIGKGKGRKQTKEAKENNRVSHIGKKQSEETVQKRVEKNKGQTRVIFDQYNVNGDFIKTWYGCREVEEKMGILYTHIHHCFSGRSKIVGGFIWKKVA